MVINPLNLFSRHSKLKYLKTYLLDLRLKIAQKEISEDWKLSELEDALMSLKNNKARDSWGHTYELFKYGGRDLKLSLLNLFNQVKRTQTFRLEMNFINIHK